MFKCVRGLPWPEILTPTVDFVCERVLKGVRGLSWSEMSTSTVDFVCERVLKCVRGLSLVKNIDVNGGLCV